MKYKSSELLLAVDLKIHRITQMIVFLPLHSTEVTLSDTGRSSIDLNRFFFITLSSPVSIEEHCVLRGVLLSSAEHCGSSQSSMQPHILLLQYSSNFNVWTLSSAPPVAIQPSSELKSNSFCLLYYKWLFGLQPGQH